jgi:ribosomal peptide maturation radical SAM protein 1
MRFRAPEPRAVLEDLLYLAERYQRLRFNAADNIIDRELFRTLLPALAQLEYDFQIFYEVKANMRKQEIARLRSAGVTEIQPGIESLNSKILQRMNKGTKALQNIRLLKWCAAYGIKSHWNIIHGTPGDTSDEYAEMAPIARDCCHLDAPNLVPLSVERFSPYHDDPASYGIEILGANQHYRYAYPLDGRGLLDIAYVFEHRVTVARNLNPGLQILRAAVDEWQAAQQVPGLRTLKLNRGPGFAVIEDRRHAGAASDYRLGAMETMIYEMCDAGTGLAALQSRLAERDVRTPAERTIQAFLNTLVEAGLVFREGTRYLSLAVEVRPRDSREAASEHATARTGVALTEISLR